MTKDKRQTTVHEERILACKTMKDKAKIALEKWKGKNCQCSHEKRTKWRKNGEKQKKQNFPENQLQRVAKRTLLQPDFSHWVNSGKEKSPNTHKKGGKWKEQQQLGEKREQQKENNKKRTTKIMEVESSKREKMHEKCLPHEFTPRGKIWRKGVWEGKTKREGRKTGVNIRCHMQWNVTSAMVSRSLISHRHPKIAS